MTQRILMCCNLREHFFVFFTDIMANPNLRTALKIRFELEPALNWWYFCYLPLNSPDKRRLRIKQTSKHCWLLSRCGAGSVHGEWTSDGIATNMAQVSHQEESYLKGIQYRVQYTDWSWCHSPNGSHIRWLELKSLWKVYFRLYFE